MNYKVTLVFTGIGSVYDNTGWCLVVQGQHRAFMPVSVQKVEILMVVTVTLQTIRQQNIVLLSFSKVLSLSSATQCKIVESKYSNIQPGTTHCKIYEIHEIYVEVAPIYFSCQTLPQVFYLILQCGFVAGRGAWY